MKRRRLQRQHHTCAQRKVQWLTTKTAIRGVSGSAAMLDAMHVAVVVLKQIAFFAMFAMEAVAVPVPAAAAFLLVRPRG